MQNDDLILAQEFCTHHSIEVSFISSLSQYGLLEITDVQENLYIPTSELQKLEQMMRMHYDMQINIEGIDAITHLLDRVKKMQDEIVQLKSKLSIYERL